LFPSPLQLNEKDLMGLVNEERRRNEPILLVAKFAWIFIDSLFKELFLDRLPR
jgi:hypothetical protein